MYIKEYSISSFFFINFNCLSSIYCSFLNSIFSHLPSIHSSSFFQSPFIYFFSSHLHFHILLHNPFHPFLFITFFRQFLSSTHTHQPSPILSQPPFPPLFLSCSYITFFRQVLPSPSLSLISLFTIFSSLLFTINLASIPSPHQYIHLSINFFLIRSIFIFSFPLYNFFSHLFIIPSCFLSLLFIIFFYSSLLYLFLLPPPQ